MFDLFELPFLQKTSAAKAVSNQPLVVAAEAAIHKNACNTDPKLLF